eukprot:TRINITY_DN2302_c0_g1_i4.p1 TRINITY_DN2302_c0_g1~~TRINITY_DN2302_c0_g1_i4.p1  ORF type:complete len:1461 (-),score=304.06 TRINITY_DN2302_c0_g1_i4:184-4566(-)
MWQKSASTAVLLASFFHVQVAGRFLRNTYQLSESHIPDLNIPKVEEHADPPFSVDFVCQGIENLTVGLGPKESPAIFYEGKRRMTLQVCYFHCAPYKTLYFGLTQGKVCMCFDRYKTKHVTDAKCNYRCKGNPKQSCGGKQTIQMHTMYLYMKKDVWDADRDFNWRMSWKQKGCFAISPKTDSSKHFARPGTRSKKRIARMPHLQPPPKAKPAPPPAASLLLAADCSMGVSDELGDGDFSNGTGMGGCPSKVLSETELMNMGHSMFLLEDSMLQARRTAQDDELDSEDYNTFERLTTEANITVDAAPVNKGTKRIIGYLTDVELSSDEWNYLYVKVADPLDGSHEGALSLEACMFPGYFVAEQDGKLELRKVVLPAKGDGQITSNMDDLNAATWLFEIDFFEKDMLTLWKEKDDRLQFLLADASGMKLSLFEDGDAFEKAATWVPTLVPESEMKCPPWSFKVEMYVGMLPAAGDQKTQPSMTRCSMAMDVDKDNLQEMGFEGAYGAIVKGNMDVEAEGHWRAVSTEESSVEAHLDATEVINLKSVLPVKKRVTVNGPPTLLEKGMHTLMLKTQGGAGGPGFALNFERVCPEKTVTNGGASLVFPIAVTGSGETAVTCPATHNGKVVMRCDNGVLEFGKMRGDCIEKKCPPMEVPSGSVVVNFEEVKQGTGTVSKSCPKTHNGQITLHCPKEVEVWNDPEGECIEKKCAEKSFDSGGVSLVFTETAQDSGEVEVPCPPTHHGSLKRTCAAFAEEWSDAKGECVEKTCPETRVASGGAEIDFTEVKQGSNTNKACPPTHHGELSMACPAEADAWAPVQGECVEKECAGGDFKSGDATLAWPTVTQGTGAVRLACPEGFAGWITRTCPAEADKWDSLVKMIGPARVAGRCVHTTPHFEIKRGVTCKSGGPDLGMFSTPDECAVAAKKAGQSFFVHSFSTQKCVAQTTRSARCREGFNIDKAYSFYGRSPAGFNAVDNAKCGIGKGFGTRSQGSCLSRCRRSKSCHHVVYYRPPGCPEYDDKCRNERRCWLVNKDMNPAKCAKQSGYATYSKTKCPGTVINSGGTNIYFKSTFSSLSVRDSGSVTMKCPESHNGEITMKCGFHAIGWTELEGKCELKVCKAHKEQSGGATLNFPLMVQGSSQTVSCPVTHTGTVRQSCGRNSESLTRLSGSCREKTCPRINLNRNGAAIAFGTTKQGTGKVTKACPYTHSGSITSSCNANAQAWTPFQGNCIMKTCPQTKLSVTGGNVVFPHVNNGRGRVRLACPNGYSGSVYMTCAKGSNKWTQKRVSCRKLCPKLGGGQHRANWWGSFDRTGWSYSSGPITGFYRTSNQWLWNIEEASFLHYERATKGVECKTANWWSSFDRKGWSSCPSGYFLQGLFRNGRIGRWQNNQLYHIEMAHCCKPKQSHGYGRCVKANWWSSFDRKGWSKCPNGYAITGIMRNTNHAIYNIEEVMCCRPPTKKCK